jgi:N-acetyl-anhydromuramoyl-L-alanine amidase
VPRPLIVDASGVVAGARQLGSPHCADRPPGTAITLAVIHGVALPPGVFGGNAVLELFAGTLDPAAHPFYAGIAHLRVSAHFFIRRDGELLQFVPCSQVAWHAGVSTWRSRDRCNDYSIGIELEGADDVPYAARQYTTLARLLVALKRRYPLEAAAGHSDIAPGRKTDPGPAFDWGRLARLTGHRLLARPLDGA